MMVLPARAIGQPSTPGSEPQCRWKALPFSMGRTQRSLKPGFEDRRPGRLRTTRPAPAHLTAQPHHTDRIDIDADW